MRRNLKAQCSAFFAWLLIIQPILLASLALSPTPAQAQQTSSSTTDTSIATAPDGGLAEDDGASLISDFGVTGFDGLSTALTSTTALQISPQDMNAVKNNQVDTRVTDYLLYLVAPAPEGAGLDHIKVTSLVKGHTIGVGKNDTETLAQSEGDNLISVHNQGKAVDISEVGEVTCKYQISSSGVFGIGGSSQTQWQPPVGVKVAWQTKDGLANNPTPTRGSLIGNAMQMSAAGLTQYLNSTGNLDAIVDFTKGVDLKSIGLYVGANVLIKDLGAKAISSDPLAGNLISALGANILKNAVPDLPGGITVAGINGDIRVSAGQANLEEQLGLPSGSLSGLGWQNILANTGKRNLEQDLGLPSGYLDSHTIQDLNQTQNAQSAFSYVKRQDDSLNVIPGTVDKLKSNNNQGYIMAGVKVLEGAFKMTDGQKALLEKAATTNAVPAIDPTTFPINNAISADAIVGLFSTDSAKQQKTIDELKQVGASLISKAVIKASPRANGGLTQTLINVLINQTGSLSTNDILMQIGAGQLLDQAGEDSSKASQLVSNHNGSSYLSTIAQVVNQTLGLPSGSSLSATDINDLFNNNATAAITKIGAAELDRAMGWNSGSGAQIMSGHKTLQTASQEIMANAIATIFNLKNGSVSITGSDPGLSLSTAIIEQNLGLPAGSLDGTTNASQVQQKAGSNAFAGLLSDAGISSAANNLLISPDTLKAFVQGKLSTTDLIKQVLSGNAPNLSADKIATYFGVTSQNTPSADQLANLIKFVTSPNAVTDQEKTTAINTVFNLVGGQVDSQAKFALYAFKNVITAKDPKQAMQLLIDQGVTLFMKTIGGNSGLNNDDLNKLGDQMKTFFNGSATDEASRQQLLSLEQLTNPTEAQRQQIRLMTRQLTEYIKNVTTKSLSDFFFKATGIPDTFMFDANSFMSGDFQYGLAATSFVLWQKQVNQYLPTDAQLTYADLHNTLAFDDADLINARAVTIVGSQAEVDKLQPDEQALLYDEARQELMNEAQKSVEYKVSDSLLRKSDPTIPVGFTEVMFTGSAADKAKMLQNFGVASLEKVFLDHIKGYQPGMLQTALNGSDAAKQQALLALIAGNTGISLGPITGPSMATYVTFLTSPAAQQASFMTDPKYASMWTAVNGWMGGVIGTALPASTAQSLYVASQNKWDFNQNITNSSGTVLVPSINSIGQNLVLQKLTGWADQSLHLPAGTAYQIYSATTSVITASHALDAAKVVDALPGGSSLTSGAQANLSHAQAGLAMVAITIALQACAACQQFFGSVDRALGAPPGFTSALVSGAIAMALHLGPAGLYIAAAILIIGLFSSTSISYLCPLPPQDPFAASAFDNSYDQMTYGYLYDPAKNPLPSSAPDYNAPPTYVTSANGTKTLVDPLDVWLKQSNVQFADGNNQNLWMAWSRYYTGRLIQATLQYGALHSTNAEKPKQLITYRRANAEYFQALATQITDAFGDIETGNKNIGIGYSQDSTKTTDWVHVSFGGL